MKNLGLVLLAIGIGLCGAFGARISSGMHANLTASGAVAMHGTVTEAALAAYCELGEEDPLPEQDLCPVDEEEAAEAPEEEASDDADAEEEEAAEAEEAEEEVGPTPAELLADQREQLAGFRAAQVNLPDATAAARNEWLDAHEAHLNAREAALSETELPAPGLRLNQWASKEGLPFGLGLLLVIAGSVMARIDQKKTAAAAGGGDSESGPVDFGVLLGEVAQGATNLHAQMVGNEQPTEADFESVKSTIDALKLDQIERLIEARIAVQARYGLETYAKIYGPLSGGERNLNRAWAAATDGHWPESLASVKAATELLEAARGQVPTA